jgi:predicted DNA-binding ribbon-helix-helix protein
MAAGLRRRSLSIAGHRTSIALEPEFWAALALMADARGLSLPKLVGEIDRARGERPLASALRVTALLASEGVASALADAV